MNWRHTLHPVLHATQTMTFVGTLTCRADPLNSENHLLWCRRGARLHMYSVHMYSRAGKYVQTLHWYHTKAETSSKCTLFPISELIFFPIYHYLMFHIVKIRPKFAKCLHSCSLSCSGSATNHSITSQRNSQMGMMTEMKVMELASVAKRFSSTGPLSDDRWEAD